MRRRDRRVWCWRGTWFISIRRRPCSRPCWRAGPANRQLSFCRRGRSGPGCTCPSDGGVLRSVPVGVDAGGGRSVHRAPAGAGKGPQGHRVVHRARLRGDDHALRLLPAGSALRLAFSVYQAVRARAARGLPRGQLGRAHSRVRGESASSAVGLRRDASSVRRCGRPAVPNLRAGSQGRAVRVAGRRRAQGRLRLRYAAHGDVAAGPGGPAGQPEDAGVRPDRRRDGALRQDEQGGAAQAPDGPYGPGDGLGHRHPRPVAGGDPAPVRARRASGPVDHRAVRAAVAAVVERGVLHHAGCGRARSRAGPALSAVLLHLAPGGVRVPAAVRAGAGRSLPRGDHRHLHRGLERVPQRKRLGNCWDVPT